MFLFRCCLNSGCSHHSSPERQTGEDLDAVDKGKLHSRLLPSAADDGKRFTDYSGCSQHIVTAQPLVAEQIGKNHNDESASPKPAKEMYQSGESGFGETSSLHQSVECVVVVRSCVENEMFTFDRSTSPSKDSLFVSSLEDQKPSDEDTCSELSPEVKYIADVIYFQSSIFSGNKPQVYQPTQDFIGSTLSYNAASVFDESASFQEQSQNAFDPSKPSIIVYKPEDDKPEILSYLGCVGSALQGIIESDTVDSTQPSQHTSIEADRKLSHVPPVACLSDEDDSSIGDTQSVSDDGHVHFVYSFIDNLPAIKKSTVCEHSIVGFEVENPPTSSSFSANFVQNRCTDSEATLDDSEQFSLEVVPLVRTEDVIYVEDVAVSCHENVESLENSLSLHSENTDISPCRYNVPNTADDFQESLETTIEVVNNNDSKDVDIGKLRIETLELNSSESSTDTFESNENGIKDVNTGKLRIGKPELNISESSTETVESHYNDSKDVDTSKLRIETLELDSSESSTDSFESNENGIKDVDTGKLKIETLELVNSKSRTATLVSNNADSKDVDISKLRLETLELNRCALRTKALTINSSYIDSCSVCTNLWASGEQRMLSDNYYEDGCIELPASCLLAEHDCNDMSQVRENNSQPLNTFPETEYESVPSRMEYQMSSDLASFHAEVDSYIKGIIQDAIQSVDVFNRETVDLRPNGYFTDPQNIQLSSGNTLSDYILKQRESFPDNEKVVLECRNQDELEPKEDEQLISASEFPSNDFSERDPSANILNESPSLEVAEDNMSECEKNVKSSDSFDIQQYYISRENDPKVESLTKEADCERNSVIFQRTNILCRDEDSNLCNTIKFLPSSHSGSRCINNVIKCGVDELDEEVDGEKCSVPKEFVGDEFSDTKDSECYDVGIPSLVEMDDEANIRINMVVEHTNLRAGFGNLENLTPFGAPQQKWPVPSETKSPVQKFSPTGELVVNFFENYVLPMNHDSNDFSTSDVSSLLVADTDDISSALDQLELELQSMDNDAEVGEPTLAVQVLQSDVIFGSIHADELSQCHPCLSLDRSRRRKKSVRFADAVGHCLENIRHIENSSNERSLAASFQNVLPSLQAATNRRARWAERHPRQDITPTAWRCESLAHLRALFTQPGTLPDFLDRVRTSRVVLESCTFDDLAFAISGLVRVANIAYHKVVSVRYTLDSWETHSDVDAEYVPRSNDGTTDRFAFTIILPPRRVFSVGSQVEFAICYCAGNGDDVCETNWDNNVGSNYVIQCSNSDPSAVHIEVSRTSRFS